MDRKQILDDSFLIFDETDLEPDPDPAELEQCVLCGQARHQPLVNYVLDVTYCPHCAAPHFMEADRAPKAIVRCLVCHTVFNPERGGGSTYTYFTNVRMQETRPPGVLRVILLAPPANA